MKIKVNIIEFTYKRKVFMNHFFHPLNIFFVFLLFSGFANSHYAFAQDNSGRSSYEGNSHSLISPGGVFFEPLISYSKVDSKIKTSQLPIISDDTSGTSADYGLGARLGVHLSEILFLGADGRYFKSNFSDSSYGEGDGNAWNIGPTIGLQMPVAGLRLLGSYVLVGESNPNSGTGGVDLKFREPTGWRFGVGFRILAMSLNLEFEDLTYQKTDIESFGVGNISSDTNVDYTTTGAILSLSFPIEM
jgi:hypothetical protein